MVKSVFRKIANNFWLFFCLILGSLLITAILASIPIYSDGALRKMLTVELDNFSESGDGYISPGEIYTEMNFRGEYSPSGIKSVIEETSDRFEREFNECTLKKNSSFHRDSVGGLITLDPSIQGYPYTLQHLTGIEDHIKILAGRMYDDSIQEDGVIEVIVSASEYNNNYFTLDTVYQMSQGQTEYSPVFSFRVVGVFEPDYGAVDYWHSNDISGAFRCVLVSSDSAFNDYFMNDMNAGSITSSSWCYNINFYGLKGSELDPYMRLREHLTDYVNSLYEGTTELSVPVHNTLSSYMRKSNMLQLTMWIVNVPVLIMLLYYTYMVAKMIIDDDKNEISSLKCRGAYPLQIFYRYFIECGIITAFSLIAGPPLGYFMAQIIGSANGFLEFVNRTGLDISLPLSSYLYALIAGIVFMIMVLIPAYNATKTTIVQHKQKKARKNKKPFWEKAFFDVIMLGVSSYLIYLYRNTDIINMIMPEDNQDMSVYFISTVFIFGCGMFFLRIYPYILKLIYRFTAKKLPPTLYAAFVQVSRNGNENRFLIMFLVLTMSIGIYSSNTAGVINMNAEDIARYKIGADITITPDWNSDEADAGTDEGSGEDADLPAGYMTFSTDSFMAADGIEASTKVANLRGTFARRQYFNEWERNVRVMAIEPYEFTQVSWIRPSTFNKDLHWYYYMNLLQEFPTGVLISSALAKSCDVGVGDSIELSFLNTRIGDQLYPDTSLYIFGIFDYWPTFYSGYKYGEVTDFMIVANLDYMLTLDDSIEYDVWFKKSDDVSADAIYDKWKADGLTENVTQIEDYRSYLNTEKSDSLVMALNGLFSMGFVATMIVSFMGFLLYWLLSVRKRRLQFGVLRAMGLSKFKLSLMLFWEHLMTSGVSVLFGIFVGYLTSWLFLPILKITFKTMLPLTLSYNTSDNIKVYILVAVMILSGVIILSRYISRLKINEAVKIGEE